MIGIPSNAIDTLYRQARVQHALFDIIFPVQSDTINLN